ncbi:hypothetical protein ASPCADRAFT_128607 [Aspergillus carbonarius ITEM 5010]|uniref:Thioester reductase (TE) domain-containing protein n=1 Tax=Aspergillus carbonarius (strain ITEM 5010) TaxID=602072 RepID=A0A1R3RVH6_ASPC5|nr:hypothetical protein ASPCADRAFT_128607 [Aspergillus carbonarius ITEM 5010]
MPSFLQEQGVTVLIITAALFNIMASDRGAFHPLTHVLTAGDVANVRAMRDVLEHAPPGASVEYIRAHRVYDVGDDAGGDPGREAPEPHRHWRARGAHGEVFPVPTSPGTRAAGGHGGEANPRSSSVSGPRWISASRIASTMRRMWWALAISSAWLRRAAAKPCSTCRRSTPGVRPGLCGGTPELAEDGPLEPHGPALRYDLGYAPGQWVAEALVRRMRARGGCRWSSIGPGSSSGMAGRGATNPEDFVSRLVVGCIPLGVFPRLDQRLEYVPVDYVIAAILHIAASPRALGHSYSLETCQIINEAGYPVQLIDYTAWVQEVAAQHPREGPLAPLQPMFRERVLGDLTRGEASQWSPFYRSDNTVQALQDRPDIQYQPLDAAMLRQFMAFWKRERILSEGTD